MLAGAVKTFPAVKAQNGLVVVNGVFAMRADIFAHSSILLRKIAACQGNQAANGNESVGLLAKSKLTVKKEPAVKKSCPKIKLFGIILI